eukprot:6025867-Pyramimonas_sp.AAC.1
MGTSRRCGKDSERALLNQLRHKRSPHYHARGRRSEGTLPRPARRGLERFPRASAPSGARQRRAARSITASLGPS